MSKSDLDFGCPASMMNASTTGSPLQSSCERRGSDHSDNVGVRDIPPTTTLVQPRTIFTDVVPAYFHPNVPSRIKAAWELRGGRILSEPPILLQVHSSLPDPVPAALNEAIAAHQAEPFFAILDTEEEGGSWTQAQSVRSEEGSVMVKIDWRRIVAAVRARDASLLFECAEVSEQFEREVLEEQEEVEEEEVATFLFGALPPLSTNSEIAPLRPSVHTPRPHRPSSATGPTAVVQHEEHAASEPIEAEEDDSRASKRRKGYHAQRIVNGPPLIRARPPPQPNIHTQASHVISARSRPTPGPNPSSSPYLVDSWSPAQIISQHRREQPLDSVKAESRSHIPPKQAEKQYIVQFSPIIPGVPLAHAHTQVDFPLGPQTPTPASRSSRHRSEQLASSPVSHSEPTVLPPAMQQRANTVKLRTKTVELCMDFPTDYIKDLIASGELMAAHRRPMRVMKEIVRDLNEKTANMPFHAPAGAEEAGAKRDTGASDTIPTGRLASTDGIDTESTSTERCSPAHTDHQRQQLEKERNRVVASVMGGGSHNVTKGQKAKRELFEPEETRMAPSGPASDPAGSETNIEHGPNTPAQTFTPATTPPRPSAATNQRPHSKVRRQIAAVHDAEARRDAVIDVFPSSPDAARFWRRKRSREPTPGPNLTENASRKFAIPEVLSKPPSSAKLPKKSSAKVLKTLSANISSRSTSKPLLGVVETNAYESSGSRSQNARGLTPLAEPTKRPSSPPARSRRKAGTQPPIHLPPRYRGESTSEYFSRAIPSSGSVADSGDGDGGHLVDDDTVRTGRSRNRKGNVPSVKG